MDGRSCEDRSFLGSLLGCYPQCLFWVEKPATSAGAEASLEGDGRRQLTGPLMIEP